jgi:hypothetical protein
MSLTTCRRSLTMLLALLCCLALTLQGRPALALDATAITSDSYSSTAHALAAANPADVQHVGGRVVQIIESPAYQQVTELGRTALLLLSEADLAAVTTAFETVEAAPAASDPRGSLRAQWDALRPGGLADVAADTPATTTWHTMLASAEMAQVREEMLALIDSAPSVALFASSGSAALLLYPGEGLVNAAAGVVAEIAGVWVDATVAAGKMVFYGILFTGAAAAMAGALVGCAPIPPPGNVACFAFVAYTGIPAMLKLGDNVAAAFFELLDKIQERHGRAVNGLVTYVYVKTALTQYCAYFTGLYAQNPDQMHQQAMTDSCNRAANY